MNKSTKKSGPKKIYNRDAVIFLRVPSDLKRGLEALALLDGRSVNDTINRLLKAAVDSRMGQQ